MAMVQLSPVNFLKERMSQDSMLTSLSQAAQAHGGVLGHELRERKREPVIPSYATAMSQDSRHQPWHTSPWEAFQLILLGELDFPSRVAQPV